MGGQIRAPAQLAKQLTQAFFEAYGDTRQMQAASSKITDRLSTPVVQELEQHAGVRYDELVGALPEEGLFSAEALKEAILENAGRGTPLSPCDAEVDNEEG